MRVCKIVFKGNRMAESFFSHGDFIPTKTLDDVDHWTNSTHFDLMEYREGLAVIDMFDPTVIACEYVKRIHDCPCKSEDDLFEEICKAWEEWQNDNGDLDYAWPSIDFKPNEPAHEGPCILVHDFDENWCDGKPYVSETLMSPTWGQVARKFDKAIPCTGDTHHCFLEGLRESINRSDALKRALGFIDIETKVLMFCTGS